MMNPRLQNRTPSGWTSWRIAGCLLLLLPASMLLFSLLNQCFHFAPHGDRGPGADIGSLFVIWFGVSLARGRTTYRTPALLVACLYFVLFTALAIVGPMMPGDKVTLNIVVPIPQPKAWQYLALWLISVVGFGLPAWLLFRRNRWIAKTAGVVIA